MEAEKAAAAKADQVLPLPEAEQGLWLLCEPERRRRARLPRIDHAESHRRPRPRSPGADAADAGRPARRACARRSIPTARRRRSTPQPSSSTASISPICRRSPRREAEAAKNSPSWKTKSSPGCAGLSSSADLLKLGDAKHLLLLVFHHVVGNGPSYWVFLDELAALYKAYATGGAAQLPPAVPFSEFVEQRADVTRHRAEKREAEAFWLKQMEGGVPMLDLPLDHPLPAGADLRRRARGNRAGAGADRGAEKDRRGAPLLAVHGAAQRLRRAAAPALGPGRLSSACRSTARSAWRSRAATFSPTRPTCCRCAASFTTAAASSITCSRSRRSSSRRRSTRIISSAISSANSNLPRDPSRSPFFNVIFNLESGEFHRIVAGTGDGARNAGRALPQPARHRDVRALPERGGKKERRNLRPMRLQHRPDRHRKRCSAGCGHYKTLLHGIAADPNQLAALIPLMSAEEQQELVVAGKATAAASPAA